MKGLEISISLNEFVAAALLITLAVVGVGYWHTHRAPAVVLPAPVPPTVTCTSAAPVVTVTPKIIVPKPKIIVIYPSTTVDVTPSAEQMKELHRAKVWDNDNIPSASDPLTWKHRAAKTASLNK